MRNLWVRKGDNVMFLTNYPRCCYFSSGIISSVERGKYRQNGILFCFIKEGHSDIYHNMDESQGHYAKWNNPVKKRQNLGVSAVW